MPTGLRVALGLFVIAVIAAILGFGIIQTPILPWARIAFYIAGTLCIPALFLGLLDR
jgi:uncharacterized membrane protein YtjA (UPF0391 family)